VRLPAVPVDKDGKVHPYFWQSHGKVRHWYIKWPQLLYPISDRSITLLYSPADEWERTFVAALCAELWFARVKALTVAKAGTTGPGSVQIVDAVNAGCAWRRWGKLT
jgi:hypothetical protein